MMFSDSDLPTLLRRLDVLQDRVDVLSQELDRRSRIHVYDTGQVDYAADAASFSYVAVDSGTTYLTPLWLDGKLTVDRVVAYVVGNPLYAAKVGLAIYRVDRPQSPVSTVVSATPVAMTSSTAGLQSRTFSLLRAAEEPASTAVDGSPVSYPVRVVFRFPRGLELDPTRNVYALAWQSLIDASASPRVVMWMSPNTWFSATIGSMTYDTSIPHPSWVAGHTPTDAGSFPASLSSQTGSSVGSPAFRVLSSMATGVLIR